MYSMIQAYLVYSLIFFVKILCLLLEFYRVFVLYIRVYRIPSMITVVVIVLHSHLNSF